MVGRGEDLSVGRGADERTRGTWWKLLLIAVVAAGVGFGLGYLLVL